VWSSCRAYASGARDPQLTRNSYYLELGGHDSSRQRHWRELLMGDDPKEPFIRREDRVVGDPQFQQSLQSKEADLRHGAAVGHST
jgi:hypothetical protein